MSVFGNYKIRRYANAVATVCLYELAPDRFDVRAKKAMKSAFQQWNINSTKDLVEKLNWLISNGKREAFNEDRRKLMFISEESRKTFFQSPTATHDRHFPLIQTVNEGSPQLSEGGVAAVDFAWCIMLAMSGIQLKFMDQDYAQAFITKAISGLQESFNSWEDFIIGFAVGSAYSSGLTFSDFFDRHKRFFVQQLVGRNSPAKRVKWTTSPFA